MNARERVLTALAHQEPDRVPIDLGGSVVTSISKLTYAALREHLELRLDADVVEPCGDEFGFILLCRLARVDP